MSRKNIPQKTPTKKKFTERKSVPWRYRFLTVICGLLLVVGFFFAARQHFASFDFRVKNSKLKKQIEELEADRQRLLLSKEIALSHTEIKKAARKIGMTDAPLSKVSNSAPNVPLQEILPAVEKAPVEKPKSAATSLVKTATKIVEPKKESKKTNSEIKKLPEAKDKQNKTKPAPTAKK